MRKYLVVTLLLTSCLTIMQGQVRYSNKHTFRPGLSMSYLPTWVLDTDDGNSYGTVFLAGIYGHQEIWKESVFIFGASWGNFESKEEDDQTAFIFPVKLQKYFSRARKGFNLTFGFMLDQCKTCNEKINGAFSYDISYLLVKGPVRMNGGLQVLQGALFDDTAIHVGAQVQFIYYPQNEKKN